MRRLSQTQCVRKNCRGINMTQSRKKIKSVTRTFRRRLRREIKCYRKKTQKLLDKVMFNKATDKDEKKLEIMKRELTQRLALYGLDVINQTRDESKRTARRNAFYSMKRCKTKCVPKNKE
jgi:GTPase involved in cell partitioning and DNA repair